MAYYLTIKEKNNLKLLDVSNLDEFTRLSKYKGGVYSLEEIDLFTECFDDEIELKRRLLLRPKLLWAFTYMDNPLNLTK